jgi:acyl-CoA dehydrogenase
MTALVLALLVVLSLSLLHRGRAWLAWFVPSLLALGWWRAVGDRHSVPLWTCVAIFALIALATGIRPLRSRLFGRLLLRLIGPRLPRPSRAEREALEAGTTGWDAELFSGRPRWRRLLESKPAALSDAERAFLGGPVEEVCRMTDDWGATQEGELSEEVWSFLREQRFFGLRVPERFGGLGFSAAAHSAIVTKLTTRSVALGVTAMFPNSMGLAEILLEHGTEEQREHWLPRLARGEELPCFALTETGASPDTAALASEGVVCHGLIDGRRTVGVRLTWERRHVAIAPVATVIGLAFRLRDPDGLLGTDPEPGITFALVPAELPGVEIGRRHDPMGLPFPTGPTRGTDVFVPLDAILGGPQQAGRGWRVLIHALATGRGIALPGMAAGLSQLAARTAGAHAAVHEHLGVPIGRLEGIEARLAGVAGRAWLIEAMRGLTVGALNAGERPLVVTAVAKCWLTEALRDAVNDAMDVLGGSGPCRGPRNLLAAAHQVLPIAIAVEGANVLMRSALVSGQGMLRCHPHFLLELDALRRRDVAAFDRAVFAHAGHAATNGARAFLLGLTGGGLAPSPVRGPLGPAFSQLARLSAATAFTADVCWLTLGRRLKQAEAVSGRIADALAWMLLASAALKRHLDEGQPAGDAPLVRWGVQTSLFEVERALAGVIDNLPARPAAWLLRAAVLPLGARQRPPSDALVHEVARCVLEPGEVRDRLTHLVHLPGRGTPGLAALEEALERVVVARPARRKLAEAVRAGRLAEHPPESLAERAVAAGELDAEEAALLRAAVAARAQALRLDEHRAATEAVLEHV